MAGDKIPKFTPNMRRGVEVMLAHPTYTYEQVAKEVGCSTAAVRKWKHHPLFQEELDKRLKEEWKDARVQAQRMMMRLSEGGDYQATKYILDSNGYAAPQQIDIKQNVIQVTIDEEGDN